MQLLPEASWGSTDAWGQRRQCPWKPGMVEESGGEEEWAVRVCLPRAQDYPVPRGSPSRIGAAKPARHLEGAPRHVTEG